MQKLKLPILTILTAIVIFFGCTKGDSGTTGITGATGSANVVYSAWNPLQMTFSTTDSMYEQSIKADSLSQTILDSGVILTYIKYVNPSTQQTQVVNAGSYLEEIFNVDNIMLYSTADFSGLSFRYVLIPEGLKAARVAEGSSNIQGYSKAQWQAMTYDEVMAVTSKK